MDDDNSGGIIGCYSPNQTYEASGYVHEISDLSVSGLEISATRKAGGLIGYYSGDDDATMKNCSVTDCVISITYNENVTSTNLFVGALIGEYAMALTVLGGNSVATSTCGTFMRTVSALRRMTDRRGHTFFSEGTEIATVKPQALRSERSETGVIIPSRYRISTDTRCPSPREISFPG